MKRAHPWLTVLFFLGCVVLGALYFEQRAELQSLSAERTTAADHAHEQVADLQHQLVTAKATQTQLAKQIGQLTAESAGPRPPPGAGGKGDARIIHLTDIMKDHPEYAALYAKDMRRNITRMYGDSLTKLNLSSEKVTKLKDLLAEQQMGNMDAQQAAEAAGMTRGSPEWVEAMKQAHQSVQQDIDALVGPNSGPTLQRLQADAGFQNQVQSNFAPDFADAGLTLSADQSRAVVQALSDTSYAGKDESGRPANYNTVDPTTGLSPHDQKIIDEAAQTLTPDQVQILKTHQIEKNQQGAVMRQYTQGAGSVMIVP
jgi:hypothetical protein